MLNKWGRHWFILIIWNPNEIYIIKNDKLEIYHTHQICWWQSTQNWTLTVTGTMRHGEEEEEVKSWQKHPSEKWGVRMCVFGCVRVTSSHCSRNCEGNSLWRNRKQKTLRRCECAQVCMRFSDEAACTLTDSMLKGNRQNMVRKNCSWTKDTLTEMGQNCPLWKTHREAKFIFPV